MKIHREDYLEYMTFGRVERPLFAELFGPLLGLEDEWRAQGASEEEIAMTAFGFDYVQPFTVQANTGFHGGRTPELVEETAAHRIEIDRYGRRVQLCKGKASIALPLDHPVHDMGSWLKFKSHYLFNEERFAEGWVERALRARAAGALIKVNIPGGFDEPRQLMGEAAVCVAYYEEPEMMQDMLETFGSTAERVLDRVSAAVPVDMLSVHEDLAGKSGPLVGPRQIEEFIGPYYLRIWEMLESRGARLFQQDSDGNMVPVLDAFMEAGLNCSFPMEPAAGMDIVAMRQKYGRRLSMLGGIDKHVLRRSKEEILRELEYKLQPLMREGGMVFSLDHRIPPGTPLENYRFYVRTAREMLGLEPDPAPSWGRMAF